MATRSSLEGVADLTRKLNQLSSLEEGRALRACVRAGMHPVLKRAEAHIPVGSEAHRLAAAYHKQLVAPGFSKQSLRLETAINGAKNIADAVVGVLKEAFYIVSFVDRGTRYQRRQPWLARSLAEGREDGEVALRDSLRKSVLRAAR